MNAAHLDYDALADLVEGILDDATARSAEHHLIECADCRDRAAEVAEVTRVLAEAPIPPMPAHLVDRLDAAIAAEALSHVPRHRHFRRFQFLAAAAAAVVVVGGGGVVARTILDDGDTNSATVTQRPVEEPSRAHTGDTRPRPQAAKTVPYAAVRSGRAYTATGLAAQVSSALAAMPPGGRHSMSAAVDGTLDACIGQVSGGRTPLLVDSATYEGRPATVIVLSGGDAGHTDVWIVGPRCSAHERDLLTHRQITLTDHR